MGKLIKRIPEQELAMTNPRSVSCYDGEGYEGCLRPIYLLGADIISGIFPKKGRCLDIGCGSGQFTIEYARRIPQLKVIAIDLSKEMISLAKKNLNNLSGDLQERITFKAGDMLKLSDFPSKSFDAFVCSYAIHHTKTEGEVQHVFKQINRILKKEGAIYIYDLLRPNSITELRKINNLLQHYPTPLKEDTLNSLQASYSNKEFIKILNESKLTHMKYFVMQRGILIVRAYQGERSKFCESNLMDNYNEYSELIKKRYELGVRQIFEAGFSI